MDKPLIHTSRGNLPVEDLVYTQGFAFQSNSITYWERYTLNGEEVRANGCAYVLPIGTKMELHGGVIG